MARLYADEDFPLPVVKDLRRLGNDVRTVQEAGRAGKRIDDAEVLADATADQRAVITHNHADFRRLHRQGQPHLGIVSCTQDPWDHPGLAQRIHDAITAAQNLANQFIRVIRPNPPAKP
jgi:predicted nuclease of predicted toxin-antitoxin system